MLPNVATLSDYGGRKQDYAPVADSSTTESADEMNQKAVDTAMMTRTAPRAILRFVGTGSLVAPADPATGIVHESMWGHDLGVKPTSSHPQSGQYIFTWPVSTFDELDAETVTNFRWAKAYAESSGTPYFVQASVTGPNTVLVCIFSLSGNPDNAVGQAFLVEVG